MGVVVVVRGQVLESNFPSAESAEGNWIVLRDYLIEGKCSGADTQGELSLNLSESSTHSWTTLYLIKYIYAFLILICVFLKNMFEFLKNIPPTEKNVYVFG